MLVIMPDHATSAEVYSLDLEGLPGVALEGKIWGRA